MVPIVPFRVGDIYRVSSKSTLRGDIPLIVPKPGEKPVPKRATIDGEQLVRYVERPISESGGTITRVLRIYEQVDNRRVIDGTPQSVVLREPVRRIVMDRRGEREVAYSLDGPLTWTELDLLRTHVWVATLKGFLPRGMPTIGQNWTAPEASTLELLGLKKRVDGSIECSLRGLVDHHGRALGQVAFFGTVRGLSEEGQTRDEARGGVYFDAATGRMDSCRAQGIREILDVDQKGIGRLDVDFQFRVEPLERAEGLSDQDVARIADSPPDSALDLLFEHPGAGIRFVHPRGWVLVQTSPHRFHLDRPGASIVLNLETPGKVPTALEFRQQVQKFLEKEKLLIRRQSSPAPLPERAGASHFDFEVELDQKPTVLDYWVVPDGERGVTVTGRFPAVAASELRTSMVRLVRSIQVYAPQSGP